MNLLIIVNPQIDFCTGGALAIPGATELLEGWHARLSNYDEVIALREWHPTDHISFAQTHLWRKPGQKIAINGRDILLQISHCVANQFGAFFHAPFKPESFSEIVNLGTNKAIETDEEVVGWLEKMWEEHWKLMASIKITICGVGHNDIFDELKKGLEQRGIEIVMEQSGVLIYS